MPLALLAFSSHVLANASTGAAKTPARRSITVMITMIIIKICGDDCLARYAAACVFSLYVTQLRWDLHTLGEALSFPILILTMESTI